MIKRSLVSLAFALVLCAGLAVAVVLATREPDGGEAMRTGRLFPEATAAGVQSVRLRNESGYFVAVRQGDGGWRLDKPIETAADNGAVDALVSHAVELEASAWVKQRSSTPPDPALFDLTPARFDLELEMKSGTTLRLFAGKRNSFNGKLYVRAGDAGRVAMVDGSLEYQLTKNQFQLREKRLVVMDNGLPDEIELELEGNRLELRRRGDDLEILTPPGGLADPEEIRQILSGLTSLRGRFFVSEDANAEVLERTGLDRPEMVITLRPAPPATPITVCLTRKPGGDGRVAYATRGGDHPVVEIFADFLFTKLAGGYGMLRDRRLLRFDRDAVARVEIRRGNVDLTLELVEADDEGARDTWQTADAPAQAAKDSEVFAMLYKLWRLRADRIEVERPNQEQLRAAGLLAPEVSIALRGRDGEVIDSLAMGRDTDEGRLCRGSRGGRIDLVPTRQLDAIPITRERFLDSGVD